MRYIFISLFFFSSLAMAHHHDEAQTDTTEVFFEMDGEVESLEVSNDILEVLASSVFYECKNVGDGWRRCSKRTGKCFGATFKAKRQCEATLHPDPNQ